MSGMLIQWNPIHTCHRLNVETVALSLFDLQRYFQYNVVRVSSVVEEWPYVNINCTLQYN